MTTYHTDHAPGRLAFRASLDQAGQARSLTGAGLLWAAVALGWLALYGRAVPPWNALVVILVAAFLVAFFLLSARASARRLWETIYELDRERGTFAVRKRTRRDEPLVVESSCPLAELQGAAVELEGDDEDGYSKVVVIRLAQGKKVSFHWPEKHSPSPEEVVKSINDFLNQAAPD